MSLKNQDRGKSTAEVLAELTDDSSDEFEYDGEIPDPAEQEWENADSE